MGSIKDLLDRFDIELIELYLFLFNCEVILDLALKKGETLVSSALQSFGGFPHLPVGLHRLVLLHFLHCGSMISFRSIYFFEWQWGISALECLHTWFQTFLAAYLPFSLLSRRGLWHQRLTPFGQQQQVSGPLRTVVRLDVHLESTTNKKPKNYT